MIIGAVISSIFTVFVDDQLIAKAFNGGFLKSTAAALFLAFVFPVSETGEVPVARSLLGGGAQPGPVVTYILAASSFNPLVIAMTAVAFPDRPALIWLRIVISLLIAIAGGAVFSILGKDFSRRDNSSYYAFQWARGKLNEESRPAYRTGGISDKVLVALEITRDELFYLMRFLICGALAAAFIRLFVSQSDVSGLTGGTAVSIIALMLLGILVCINSSLDSAYIVNLSGNYIGGAVLGFLVAGSMMDLKSVAMLFSVFRARAVALLVFIVLTLTFVLSLLSGYLFF